MYIECINNNGSNYLRLSESKYFTKNGKPSCKKIVVRNIGPLAKFDDGKPNFVQRLKDSFKNGNPLISSLKEYVNNKPVFEKYDINLSEGDPDCIGHNKLFSSALLERILEEIGVTGFVNRYKALTNYEFDLMGFVRLLIYGRILNPASKIATIDQSKDYYSDVLNDYYEYNVYDTLDFLDTYKTSIVNKINKNLIEKFKRTTNVIYYDVTNFFFEIEEPDDDEVDDDGNTTEKGLRKYGVCKEERKLPIVQMGLFMDEQGLPISIETFPGNTLDHLTLIDALNDTIENLNLSRFIFVGDRGMYRGNNTYYLTNKNNGYIISKSIDKTSSEERKWIYAQDDYVKENDDFKYKSHIIKRAVHINKTETKEIIEKIVVYWSKKFYDKQIAENKSFLDFIDKLQNEPSSFRITKTQSRSLKRFLKDDIVNNKTGEVINSKDLKPSVDFNKVNKYKEQFGYYQIVSSELNMDDLEIIDTYHGLSRIEDQFKIMKGDLETRPLFVRTESHINAHLLICMIALTIVRIIQNKIVGCNKKDEESKKNWETGLSSKRIQDALKKWTVVEITNGLYRFNDIDNKDLKLILNSFNIDLPCKLFRKMELHNIKTNIKILN
jgi:transposase